MPFALGEVSAVSVPAVVLQAFAFSETSKILRLFTRDHGLRSVIAKGALRPRSRFGGLLEPFSGGTAQFRLKPGADLHTLAGWDLVRSRQVLGRDLVAFSGASLLAEIVLRAGTEEAQPLVYQRLCDALDELVQAEAAEREFVVIASAWQLVSLLGFAPQTEECVSCGRWIDPAEDARFDALAGGVACAECRPARRVLRAGPRQVLARMLADAESAGELAEPAVQRTLLRNFVDAQLGAERPLRSMELFVEQVAARAPS